MCANTCANTREEAMEITARRLEEEGYHVGAVSCIWDGYAYDCRATVTNRYGQITDVVVLIEPCDDDF